MDFHAALSKVTCNVLFRSWHSKHGDFFLAHAFMMLDKENEGIWQFGFYNPSEKKMTTFILDKSSVEKTSSEGILETGSPISELDPSSIVISAPDALKKADDRFISEYKRELPLKKFFIIQVVDSIPVFNITYFTQSFKTVNIKIDAREGKLVNESIQSLVEFA